MLSAVVEFHKIFCVCVQKKKKREKNHQMRYFLMHFFVSRNLTLSIILFGQATKEDEMHLLKRFCNLVPGILGFNSDSLPSSIILPPEFLEFWKKKNYFRIQQKNQEENSLKDEKVKLVKKINSKRAWYPRTDLRAGRRPGRLARKRDRLRKHNQSQNELKRNSGQLTFYKNMRYAYVPIFECVLLKPFYKRWKKIRWLKNLFRDCT